MLVGTLSVWTGASLGATIAFFLGRHIFSNFVQNLSKKYTLIKAVNKAIEQEGLKLIFLLRLCPLIPFNAFNYLMGITAIRPVHYVLGMGGMLPGTAVFVFVGTTVAGVAEVAEGAEG